MTATAVAAPTPTELSWSHILRIALVTVAVAFCLPPLSCSVGPPSTRPMPPPCPLTPRR